MWKFIKKFHRVGFWVIRLINHAFAYNKTKQKGHGIFVYPLKGKKNLRQFIGMLKFHSHFIRALCRYCTLFDGQANQKHSNIQISDSALLAFKKIKEKCANNPSYSDPVPGLYLTLGAGSNSLTTHQWWMETNFLLLKETVRFSNAI